MCLKHGTGYEEEKRRWHIILMKRWCMNWKPNEIRGHLFNCFSLSYLQCVAPKTKIKIFNCFSQLILKLFLSLNGFGALLMLMLNRQTTWHRNSFFFQLPWSFFFFSFVMTVSFSSLIRSEILPILTAKLPTPWYKKFGIRPWP